jgi:hypothetical protein
MNPPRLSEISIDMTGAKAVPPIAGASPERTYASDVLEAFHRMNGISLDEEGIKIPHMVVAASDGLQMHALALKPEEIYVHVARVLVRERPRELVFGMDRYTTPAQGVVTKDCLSVAHWTGSVWRFGVIAYQFQPRIWAPIDWGNKFWIDGLTREMTSAWRGITNAPHRQPSPAMELPLPVYGSEGMPQ